MIDINKHFLGRKWATGALFLTLGLMFFLVESLDKKLNHYTDAWGNMIIDTKIMLSTIDEHFISQKSYQEPHQSFNSVSNCSPKKVAFTHFLFDNLS